MRPIWAAGLMTGTVLDGNIDVALLRTDGESVAETGPFRLIPYPSATLSLLQQSLEAARSWNFSGDEPEIFIRAEEALTLAQADAVAELAGEAGLSPADIGIVGFHGQTVLHRPPSPGKAGRTRQLGNGALMAERLGTRVGFDFRSADIAAGGQGAPLAPVYHMALLRGAGFGPETAVVNLGGVGNITWWDGAGMLVAFDTGPGNAPLNDFMRARGLGEMDRDGALGGSGHVDDARLSQLLAHPFLDAPFPKSLDRFDFTAAMADGLDDADGAALLSAFTAASVAKGLALLPQRPRRLIICGGGRRNPTIMAMLAQRAGVETINADALGWRGDAVEAECFAFLAVRSLRGLPISFPGTTGAPHPLAGGRIAHPLKWTQS